MDCNSEYIIRLATVDSTNRYMRDEAALLWNNSRKGKDFVVVVADFQTAGRGQRGNVWSSQDGQNLLFSIMSRPGQALEVSNQFLLSQAAALAIHTALKSYGIDTRLKWPNDIYVGNRKLAGILVEVDYSGIFVEQAIIGIGLNVNQTSFPEMDRLPVSMQMLLGREISKNDVLLNILNSFGYYYNDILCGVTGGIATEYSDLLLGRGEMREFATAAGRFSAVIEGVTSCGYLLLRRQDGTLSRYAFKEVEQLL